ncbi:MAG: CPBP family intramembrane metalloprotease [Tidjanibacter sp.]|nr:CPBP family intramembrane metalloprotease [Tidjanibacter sp.]
MEQNEKQIQEGENVSNESKQPVAPQRKFPRWGELFAVVGVFVLSNILASIVMTVVLAATGHSAVTIPEDMGWLFPVVQILTFLPVILFVVYLRRRAGLKHTGVHLTFRRMNAPMILWGVLLVFVSSMVIEPLLNLLPDAGMDALDDMMGNGGWSVLSAVVIAPVLEEYLFRGLFIDSARRRMNALWAVLISSALFGLAHGIPQQAFNAFVVGLILGYVYVRTNSLAAVITIHAINNGISYVLLELFGSSTVLMKDLIANDTVYYIVYGVCFVIFVVSMVKFVVSLRDSDEIVGVDNKTE